MLVSKISRHGARIIKDLTRGHLTSVSKMAQSHAFCNHYLQPLDGEEKVINVPIEMSMLEAALEHDIDIEGACEGSCACSTCHVIVQDMEYYNKLEDPTDEENDMLDLAFGLTEKSHLGCQLIAEHELDGIRLALPSAI
ncbi:hypothetical protein RGQ29_021591 [Quercus rubra]|uniref:2Fe-2S ferredoxin-type domain-containing protein n=1 Tax=Quercus rubra TaxID=3512 RepID=A0AAN7FDH5_QUERU|nr:hypothetical protein RGQ29_021591 [Quercus rubra]